MPNQKPIILFDGVCNLCNGAVQFVIKKDKKNLFLFASLQSEAGEKLYAQGPVGVRNTDSFVLISEGQYYTRSTAALQVLKQLGGVWKLLFVFIIVPKFIRDGIYNFIAKNRYEIFGKRESCMMPSAEISAKFLS